MGLSKGFAVAGTLCQEEVGGADSECVRYVTVVVFLDLDGHVKHTQAVAESINPDPAAVALGTGVVVAAVHRYMHALRPGGSAQDARPSRGLSRANDGSGISDREVGGAAAIRRAVRAVASAARPRGTEPQRRPHASVDAGGQLGHVAPRSPAS